MSKEALRDLKKAPKHIEAKAWNIIKGLADNPRPHGCKKLKGSERTWRVRAGDWRIIYDIWDDKLFVFVIGVPPRGGAYE